ncbi:alpha/beta fold hydrolase [Kribbella deserti]|uniref:Alpha/beta fold hydrolase n=1 Tax=Kribbella deserti TaxID=1926257 RepID=A0ABV6QWA2_9ACTN
MRNRLGALTALTVVLVSCVSPTATPTPSPAPSTTAPQPAVSGPKLENPQPCAETPGFTCTTLRVPIDHRRPNGRRLELSVAAADNADAPRGVLLLLAGGPGQPGVSLVNRIRTYFDPAVLAQYRLVMFDQRGTGPKGINCQELQKSVGGSDWLTPAAEAVTACSRQLGDDRHFYRSTDTVADIEWLRRALGQQRLTVDGVSYGTFTGAHYALSHPSRVRALILDSVVPFTGIDPFSVDLLASTRKVLAAACAKDPACTTDPVADLAWLIRNGQIDGKPINGINFVESLSVASVSSVNPAFRGIPKMLNDARNGDTARLKTLLERFTTLGTPADQLSAGLHLATLCADMRLPWGSSETPLALRPAALDRAVARLDPAELYPYDVRTARAMLLIEGCLRWEPARASTYSKLPRLVPPTLILHGTNDLFVPVEGAEWTKRQAPRGELVVVPGGGHGIQGSPADPAGKNAVRSFLLR